MISFGRSFFQVNTVKRVWDGLLISVCVVIGTRFLPQALTFGAPLMLLPLPRWMVTSWSACTRSCGGGIQTRRVTCQKLKASGISTPVSNDMCTQLAKRPVDTQACNQQLCVEWAFSTWGQVRARQAFI